MTDALEPNTSYDIHVGLTQIYADMFAAKMEKEGYEVSQLGDGWESWGDDRGTNGNDVNTFHIVLRVPSVETAIANAMFVAKNYTDIIVRAGRQLSQDRNDLIVCVTESSNWDTKIVDIFQDEHGIQSAKFRSVTVNF